MTVLRKGFFCAAAVLIAAAIMAPPAGAANAIRLEKEVLKSAVIGSPPLTVRLFSSRTATRAVAAQSFGGRQFAISKLATVSGQALYRIRLDFSKTEALTRDMDLWWELWLAGRRLGSREPVAQSAWALFAVDADTVDGMNAADLAPADHDHPEGTHNHDTSYYTRTELQTSGSAGVHWDNITNAPAALTMDNIYRTELTDGSATFVPCTTDGDKVLGGGGSCATDGYFIASYPSTVTSRDRWTVVCQDALGVTENAATVFAVCIGPVTP